MTPRHTFPEPPDTDRLARLESRVRDDLDHLLRPGAEWMAKPREDVVDVAIIGAGMCGLAAGFALLSAGVRDIRILDRAPEGLEGPWRSYARMETLRSPKQLVGPACGMASLTFRAWFTAAYGEAAWAALGHIPTGTWMDYLVWYRRVLELPVENGVEVRRIAPAGDLLDLDLGVDGHLPARRVVMATGRDGVGRPYVPDLVAALPRHAWAHGSDEIDFARLTGKRVVVIGVGSSAVDNAAEALEAGAAEVRLLARRAEVPRVNKLMGIANLGFAAGFLELSDEWRWRFMHHAARCQTPAPRDSTLRVSRHANAFFHFDAAIARAGMASGGIELETVHGARLRADFLIAATGFTVAPASRAEFAGWGDEIALWRDRYSPPEDEADEVLAGFPYLARDFAFRERIPGRAPWLSRIHCFNHGSMLSLGKLSGDIPDVSQGALWLARAVAGHFYVEDVEHHWRHMESYETPELLGDEWTASPPPPAPKDE